MRILIVGATSGIAKECARIWAGKPGSQVAFLLVGRNQAGLDAVAADLVVRNPSARVRTFALDLTDPARISKLETELGALGLLDIALIAQGELTDQSLAQASTEALEKSVTINATSVALFAELSARLMSGGGKIAVIGSVAGDRGRRANYAYGASKAFLHTFVRGMQHRFAGTGVLPIIVKPGPTATPMTTALAVSGKLAPADAVAREIVSGIAKGKKTIYAPGLWAVIMLVVRLIPSPIFDKLNF
ncbi:MAG: SDR family NAD(P)-dependent oxidoreductase [Micrococcales bacterium]